MADYPTPPDDFTVYEAERAILRRRIENDDGVRITLADVMTEHEYLTGETPHPAAVEHMQHAIDRVKPPSLVRMDRAEDALAAVVARRKLEQHGQILTDDWWDLKRYEDSIVDRYIEETT